MTKQELVNQITGDYKRVGEPVKVDSVFGVTTYDVPVFEVTETGATKKTISFYIVDEGKESEEAYLRNKKVEKVVEPIEEPTK